MDLLEIHLEKTEKQISAMEEVEQEAQVFTILGKESFHIARSDEEQQLQIKNDRDLGFQDGVEGTYLLLFSINKLTAAPIKLIPHCVRSCIHTELLSQQALLILAGISQEAWFPWVPLKFQTLYPIL